MDVALLKGQAHGSEETIRKLTAAQEKRLQHISEIHSKQLKMEREKYEKLLEARHSSTQQALDDIASLSVTRLQNANDMEVKSSIMKEKLLKREEQIEELKEVVNKLQHIADDRLSISNKAKLDMTLFKDKLEEREKQLTHKNNIVDKIREELQKSAEKCNMHQIQLMAANEIISEYKVNMRKICLKNLSLLFRKALSSKVKDCFFAWRTKCVKLACAAKCMTIMSSKETLQKDLEKVREVRKQENMKFLQEKEFRNKAYKSLDYRYKQLQSTINDEKLSLDSHLEELRKRHMVELEELSRQNEVKLRDARNEIDIVNKKLRSGKTENSMNVEKVKRVHREQIEEMAKLHEAEVKDLRSESDKHREYMQEVEREHQKIVHALKETHLAELKNMKKDHDKAYAELLKSREKQVKESHEESIAIRESITERYETQLNLLKNELSDTQRKSENDTSAFKLQIKELKRSHETHVRDLVDSYEKRLQTESQDIKTEISQEERLKLKEAIASLSETHQHEIERMTKRLVEEEGKCLNQEQHIKSLKRDLEVNKAEWDNKASILQDLLDKATKSNTKLKAEVDKIRKQLFAITNKRKQDANIEKDLNNAVKELKERLRRVSETHDAVTEEKEKLVVNFNKINLEREILAEEEKNFQSKIHAYDEKIKVLLVENSKLREERRETITRQSQIEDDRDRLTKSSTENINEILQLKQRVKSLDETIRVISAEKKSLGLKLDDITQKYADILLLNKEQVTSATILQRRFDKMSAENIRLNHERDSLKLSLNKSTMDLETNSANEKELQNKFQIITQRCEKLQDENNNLKNQQVKMDSDMYKITEERENLLFTEKKYQQQIIILEERLKKCLAENKEIKQSNINLLKVKEAHRDLNKEKQDSEWSSTKHAELGIKNESLQKQVRNVRVHGIRQISISRLQDLRLRLQAWKIFAIKSCFSKARQAKAIKYAILRMTAKIQMQKFNKWKNLIHLSVVKEMDELIVRKERELTKTSAKTIQDLKAEHKREFKRIENEHDKSLRAMNRDHELAIEKIRHQHDEVINIEQNKNSSKMKSYQRDHEVKLAEILERNSNIRRKFDLILDTFAMNKARHQASLEKIKVFRSWCKYVLSMHLQRKKYLMAASACRQNEKKMLLKIIFTWKQFAERELQKRYRILQIIKKKRFRLQLYTFSKIKGTTILAAHQEFKSRFDDLTSRRFLNAKDRFKLAKTLHVWRTSSLQCVFNKKTMHKIFFIKQRRCLRACFVRFITHTQESVLSRKLLTRMFIILSKRFLLLRLSRWKAVVYRYKIEDALCLGHDAMRKTKVDMAKRLYSRARRGRLNGAMLKWKAETQNDRTMEEHANAVEAMSNWAARIAGGRILKERFQTWIAYTYKMLWEKSERRVSLKYNLMRFMKMKIFLDSGSGNTIQIS